MRVVVVQETNSGRYLPVADSGRRKGRELCIPFSLIENPMA
jgi:hypothetical protein